MKEKNFIDQIRNCLSGPLMSIRTPFLENGDIDEQGLKLMLEKSLEEGNKTALLTAGDGLFDVLSHDEIFKLNEMVAKYIDARALVVGADWQFSSRDSVELAKRAKDAGVDIYMLRPPDWANSCTVDTLVEHFARVSEVIPVMIVTNLFASRTEDFTLKTIEALKTVPNIVALKEDLMGDIAKKICMKVNGHWPIFSAGGWRAHLNILPFGCGGFMDRHMNFVPSLSKLYWSHIQKGDLKEVGRLCREIEWPLEKLMDCFPGKRDSCMHALLEIYGICFRWKRKPYYSLNDDELNKLKRESEIILAKV